MDYQKDLKQFTRRPYKMKRLQAYFDHFSQDDDRILYDDNVAAALSSQGFSIDPAPRSVYKAEKLFEALSGYAPSKNHHVLDDQHLRAGLNLAYRCFARASNHAPLSILEFNCKNILAVTSNPSGSPGLTNYGCSKAESVMRAQNRGLQTLRAIKQPEPCIAFKRTQFNDKTRLVWGYPYSETAIEGMLAKPLLDEFKRGFTPMAFAMTTGALGTKLRVSSYHKEWAYSLDMSQYDATLPSYLIHLSFKILRTWFNIDEVEPVSGKKVGEIFDHIENYFIFTPIVMPDARIYLGKNHGVPSGSYFTQIIDSIANVIICGAISSKFNLNVSRSDLYVLGDDILFWSNRRVDLDDISNYANRMFGVKMHGSEKSEVFHFDEAIKFLGRVWKNGLPDLDEQEILKRMYYPEQFRKYDADWKRRQRQVHMLLLSYAAVYRSAWSIALHAIEGSSMWYGNGCSKVDVNTYCYENTDGREFDPKFMSGYDRYRMRYGLFSQSGHGIPNTAIQYWL